MVADINNALDSYFFPHIFKGSSANNGQVDPGKVTQFFQMPLYFERTKSKFGSGYNWSKGSVIIQKEEKTLGLLNPVLNVFPIFKKMFHGLLISGEYYRFKFCYIISPFSNATFSTRSGSIFISLHFNLIIMEVFCRYIWRGSMMKSPNRPFELTRERFLSKVHPGPQSA